MPLTDLQKLANGRITATFDEETLSFRSPTLSDLCDFEEQFGPLEQAFGPKSKHSTIKTTRFLIYLSLRHDQPDITEKQAGDYFAMADMDEGGVAQQIIEDLMPKGDGNPKAPGRVAK